MKPLFAILASFLLLAACQKADNDAPANPAKVVINLSSPVQNALYRRGDSIKVVAAVSYTTELHGCTLTLTDSASQANLWTRDIHQHDDHLQIAESWADTLSTPATLLLNVKVVIDHDGHYADTTLRLYSKP